MVYPFALLKAGVGGKARIDYMVDASGKVFRAEVTEATTPEMGLAVRAMIETWEFTPAKMKDGTPGKALLNMALEFFPSGRDYVPVTKEAKQILEDLEKHPESIADAKELDGKLRPWSQRAPVYPTALRATTQAGSALIEFFIDKNGDAQLPRIVSSSHPEFGYAAAQAIATWRFDRPLKKRKPVAVRVRVPVNFTLKDLAPAAK